MGSLLSSNEQDTSTICTDMQKKITDSLDKAQKIAAKINKCEQIKKNSTDANIILELNKKLDELNAMMDKVQQGKLKKYMKLKNLKNL
jgi:hypothetical protein